MAGRQYSTDDTLVPETSLPNAHNETVNQNEPGQRSTSDETKQQAAVAGKHYKLKRNCSSFTMTNDSNDGQNSDLKPEDPDSFSKTLTQETVDLASVQQNHATSYRKKHAYHKCGADNRDPRCVCSAKLGLDFGDNDEVFDEFSPTGVTNSHPSYLPRRKSSARKQHLIDSPDAGFENHVDFDDFVQDMEENASVVGTSRISSINSEDFLEGPDTMAAQCTDSGVGSSRSWKHIGTAGVSSDEYIPTPITPRDPDFNTIFSPKSSCCDSEPEEAGSQYAFSNISAKNKRRTLSDSESSWSSNFSSSGYLNDLVAECDRFMKTMVANIFNPSAEITQQEKARFGQLCQHGAGRQCFAKYINEQRSKPCVPELVFFRLQQFFSVCLFECDHEDDYVPAKSLMLTCFVFYTDIKPPHGKHEHLFSGIKTQPIWQSLKFWNAAFFDAVHCEGMHRGQNRIKCYSSSRTTERQKDDDRFHEIVFKQLREFTKHMRQLEVPKELNVEFLVKQSMVGKLTETQTCILREAIEKLYSEP